MLTEITIANFRSFEDLKLTGLGRVNLIVGKNNTGKTSLLEAISILADPATLTALPGLFRATTGMGVDRFYRWLIRDARPPPAALLRGTAEQGHLAVALGLGGRPPTPPAPPGQPQHVHMAFGPLSAMVLQGVTPLRVRAICLEHRTLDSAKAVVQAFAEAVRSPAAEREMEVVLRAVDPRVGTLRLDLEQKEHPLIVVDLGLSERIPLSQAGQGMYRLVAVLAELLGAPPDVAFLDEIENGIHHSALEQVWTGLAEVAERLGIQLFVTTHSYECIEAAHAAFSKRPNYDLRVIQLSRAKTGVEGRVLDRDHIAAGLEGGRDRSPMSTIDNTTALPSGASAPPPPRKRQWKDEPLVLFVEGYSDLPSCARARLGAALAVPNEDGGRLGPGTRARLFDLEGPALAPLRRFLAGMREPPLPRRCANRTASERTLPARKRRQAAALQRVRLSPGLGPIPRRPAGQALDCRWLDTAFRPPAVKLEAHTPPQGAPAAC
jgi:ABC-type transport system involved in cytochrome c biogenesis ATPase subunit